MHRFTRQLMAVGLVALATGAAASSANAAALSLSIGIPVASAGPELYAAQQIGAFKKEGVNVTINLLTSPTTITSVASGQDDLGVYSAPPLALVSASGKRLVSVAAIYSGGIAGVMVGAKGITSTAALAKVANCKIATLPAGTESYYFAAHFANKFHTKCQVLPLTSPGAIVAAVEQGQAQAAVQAYGADEPIIQAGGTLLVDTRNAATRKAILGGLANAPDTVIFGAAANLASKRAAVVAFLKGLELGREYMQRTSASAIAKLLAPVPALATLPAAQLLATVQGVQPYLPYQRGYISAPVWKLALTAYNNWGVPGYSSTMATAGYSQAVDMSYFDKALGAPKP